MDSAFFLHHLYAWGRKGVRPFKWPDTWMFIGFPSSFMYWLKENPLLNFILLIMAFQNFTPDQAIPKIKQYCDYQERCHAEVRDKLYSYGLYKNDVEPIISLLINENYLNEERFAILYAGGKFRVKHWGKIKIKQALKFKQVSDYCIKNALKEIDDFSYEKTFQKLAEQKMKTLKSEKNIFVKKRKLQDYLLQKGYESSLIGVEVNKIGKK